MNVQARYNPKVDNRKNLYELENLSKEEKEILYPDLEKIKTNALAVACLMTSSELIETSENYIFTSGVTSLSDRVSRSRINKSNPELGNFNAPLAPIEKFRKEPAPGFGSCFFIKGKGRKKMLTAGHCICTSKSSELMSKKEMDEVRVVFRFHKNKAEEDKRIFEKKDVYKIKKIVGFNFNHLNYSDEVESSAPYEPDWALFKLDRPVDEEIKPLEIAFSAKIGREIYALGCPTGTAVKFAGPAHIKVIDAQIHGDTDTFAGNSGCPIFDRLNDKVIGILVNGPSKDYAVDEAHLKDTGQRRVITFVVTPEMIATQQYRYSGIQKMKPYMFNREKMAIRAHNEMLARTGRLHRKNLSNANSALYEKNLIDEIEDEKSILKCAQVLSKTIIAAPGGLVLALFEKNKIKKLEDNLKVYKEIRSEYIFKINTLEAKQIGQLPQENLSDLDQLRIVRNMTAYSISYVESKYLNELENEVFQRKFAPEQILCLTSNAMSYWCNFNKADAKKVLKRLRSENNGYISQAEARVATVDRIWKILF